MKARHLVGIGIAVACIAVAAFLFDWPRVAASLSDVKLGFLLGSTILALAVASLLRGLRWLVVLGARVSPASIARSSFINGAASGLAAITPVQVGEAIKIRHLPDMNSDRWRFGISAFLAERLLDLAGAVGLALAGLAVHFGRDWAAPMLLAMPTACAMVLGSFASLVDRLPARWHPYLEAFRHRRRMILASLPTIGIWICAAALWWCAADAVGVSLRIHDTFTLVGGVVLASVASLAPAGLGVSELSSRGILLWLGYPLAEAEATAVAIRLLTPLVVLFGAACLLPLLLGGTRSD